jgi:predicted nucleic acid-binding protein
MNGYLIDTNVLSEYNRLGAPDGGVKRWLETTARETQFVSVITLAEIEKGIELLADGKRRAQLRRWLHQDLEVWFSGRVLAVDREVGRRWAVLVAQSTKSGNPLPTLDSLIAATALANDLTVVTRNVRDFAAAGVVCLNPWVSS